MSPTDIHNNLAILRQCIYKPYGLVFGYVLIIGLFAHIKPVSIPHETACLLILCLIWTIAWIEIRNYFPRPAPNTIAIVFAINAENDKQKVRIKDDLVKRLNSQLESHKLSSLCSLLVLSDYRALRASRIAENYARAHSKIFSGEISKEAAKRDLQSWQNFQRRVKGHLYIWGNIKERQNIENTYVIDIACLIRHAPLKEKEQSWLRKELQVAFPRKILFVEKFELIGFQLTADHIYLTVKYIIGLAAYISGDPFTAIKLHTGLEEEIRNFSAPLTPNFLHILEQLQKAMLIEKARAASIAYNKHNDVKLAKLYIDECSRAGYEDYDFLLLRSYVVFREDKNPAESLRLNNLAKRLADGNYIWLYNKAFLFMYLEKFDRALQCYKKIGQLTFVNEESIVDQCIKFNETVLTNEPSKVQSEFIIGLLLLIKKSDRPAALEHFEKFINAVKYYPNLKPLLPSAEKYSAEIKNSMGLKSS